MTVELQRRRWHGQIINCHLPFFPFAVRGDCHRDGCDASSGKAAEFLPVYPNGQRKNCRLRPEGIDSVWLMKSPPAALFISRPKEAALAMETPLLKTLIMAIVSSACNTIAITLPVMTPWITPNLVFRILSSWNGWVEGAGRGPGQGSAEAGAERGTPAEAYLLPMISFLSLLCPSHANRGHL